MILITGTAPSENYTSAMKSCFGRFSKMLGESSRRRPVWKHDDNDKRFFFVGQLGQWQCGYEYGNNSGGYFSSLQNEALANGLPDSISTLPSIKLKGKIMTINCLNIQVKIPESTAL